MTSRHDRDRAATGSTFSAPRAACGLTRHSRREARSRERSAGRGGHADVRDRRRRRLHPGGRRLRGAPVLAASAAAAAAGARHHRHRGTAGRQARAHAVGRAPPHRRRAAGAPRPAHRRRCLEHPRRPGARPDRGLRRPARRVRDRPLPGLPGASLRSSPRGRRPGRAVAPQVPAVRHADPRGSAGADHHLRAERPGREELRDAGTARRGPPPRLAEEVVSIGEISSSFVAGMVSTVVLGSPWISRAWRRVGGPWSSVGRRSASPGRAGRAPGHRPGRGRRHRRRARRSLLIFGAPNKRPRGPAVVAAMARAGAPLARRHPRGRGRPELHALLRRRRRRPALFIKVLGRDERSADLMFRIYCSFGSRTWATVVPSRPCSGWSSTRRSWRCTPTTWAS